MISRKAYWLEIMKDVVDGDVNLDSRDILLLNLCYEVRKLREALAK